MKARQSDIGWELAQPRERMNSICEVWTTSQARLTMATKCDFPMVLEYLFKLELHEIL
jgi:hypothetical protein